MMNSGDGNYQQTITKEQDLIGWANPELVPALTDSVILDHIRKIQRANHIRSSDNLEGQYNLIVRMETGVGKVYTYIRTKYELNKAYGWSKFIVVVPIVAIREGLYIFFQR